MRFLMLSWRDPKNPLSGGAERVTRAYLAALVRRGHEVYWFANAFPQCAATEVLDGIQIVRGGGMGTSIFKAWRWYRRQPKFDLVIDQHHGIPWFAPWWAGTNCVAYIHEVLGPIWGSFYPWPLSTIGRWQERWTHWLYRNIMFWTVTEATRECLKANGVKKVNVILNGIHTAALSALPEKPLNLPLRLAAVSRLAPNKRIDHAIRTIGCLDKMGVVAQLIIVGGGDVESNLRQLIAELKLEKRITLAGPLSEAEKDAHLKNAHFLVHTSLREGWGLNVIEANAMGTPGAVYPVPGLTESTLHDVTGIIAKQETPQALAEALAEILNHPAKYQNYRQHALERARSLQWEQMLPAACAWLESLAAGNGPPPKIK